MSGQPVPSVATQSVLGIIARNAHGFVNPIQKKALNCQRENKH